MYIKTSSKSYKTMFLFSSILISKTKFCENKVMTYVTFSWKYAAIKVTAIKVTAKKLTSSYHHIII